MLLVGPAADQRQPAQGQQRQCRGLRNLDDVETDAPGLVRRVVVVVAVRRLEPENAVIVPAGRTRSEVVPGCPGPRRRPAGLAGASWSAGQLTDP
jgi:hypothetical protein